MKLNKSMSFALLHLLGGAVSAAEISEKMPAVTVRSIQRALVRLAEAGLVKRHGVTDPRYSLEYGRIIKQPVNAALLENPGRPAVAFNFGLVDWLLGTDGRDLADILGLEQPPAAGQMTARNLERLTVELSWKSSALEGNTYSLLDTELLLVRGVKAENKTSFETQMILNHKEALAFIAGNPEAFTGRIAFAAVEEIHRHLGNNLGIEAGIRERPVRISASNYQPLSAPAKLRECAETALEIIGRQSDPVAKALLAFSLMPYIQPFEDGNKRVGRLLANAILIHSIGRDASLRSVEAKELALAYLSFYEFNSLKALAGILNKELRT